jgi:hypothetical protein
VKYAIPLGTLLLIGSIIVLRPTPPSTETRGGQPERPGKAEVREWSTDIRSVLRPPEDPLAAPAQSIPELKRQAPPAPLRKAAASCVSKMIASLDRELTPTAVQRSAIEQFLKDREAEIGAWHESIFQAGVVDIRQFDWEADRLKDGWYLKIDALLDRLQHDRFVFLVQQGFLNEGLAFTVEPGMTVLD